MRRRTLGLSFPFVAVVVVVACAFAGLPLGEIAKPLLWMVVPAIALAVMFGVKGFQEKLVGLGVCLVGFIIGWPILAAVLRNVAASETGAKVTHGVAAVVVLGFLVGLFLLFAKVRAAIPPRRPERPVHWERRPILEPMDADDPWNQSARSSLTPDDLDDDLGLFGGQSDER